MLHGLTRILTGFVPGSTTPVPLGVESYEGITSLYTVPGHHHVDVIHADVHDIQAVTGVMLIDLSDTVNWPHTETGHLDVEYIHVSVNPDTSYVGDVELGFLSDVDATNGDFHVFQTWHFQRVSAPLVDDMFFGQGGHFECSVEHFFGKVTANDTTWQTDVDLVGPDGNTSYPSGDGDLVLKIGRTGGSVDVGITVGYHGEAGP